MRLAQRANARLLTPRQSRAPEAREPGYRDVPGGSAPPRSSGNYLQRVNLPGALGGAGECEGRDADAGKNELFHGTSTASPLLGFRYLHYILTKGCSIGLSVLGWEAPYRGRGTAGKTWPL